MSNFIKLYESIINERLSKELARLDPHQRVAHREKLEATSSVPLMAEYLRAVIEDGLRHFKTSEEDLKRQISIANDLIRRFGQLVEDDSIEEYKITEDMLLRGISDSFIDKNEFKTRIPQSSVATSSLFTGGQHEPHLYSELRREIATADRVDLLVSFIKYSGLRLIYDDLKKHTETKKLRVLTTSYMGASDYEAILALSKLPNTQIRLSYNTHSTRLHAKAYYFHRDTGFSTAYIGSSNLSKAALSEGTEWNLKVSEYNSADIIAKYRITFETYWNSNDFQDFTHKSIEDRTRLKRALNQENRPEDQSFYFFEICPYGYQQEILDRLEIEREVFGSFKNLIVAATGTGKTIVSAFDFKRFYDKNQGRAKLLFLAHREEILRQSLLAFRGVLRDANFGELWVGQEAPSDFSHIFASIQTLNSNEKYSKFRPDYFDYIVLDESHHSAAVSYKRIIDHFKPQILLGLTATPERLDGRNILEDFNNRIAYEIRLKEAIERNMLCPFHYFAVSDEVDLSTVRWRNGRYDVEELSQLYIDNSARDIGIIRAIKRYLGSIESIKGLGFCVSRQHARYMAKSFTDKGIASIYLDSESPPSERSSARSRLVKGEVKFIFVVDLYNEGVDIPEVNTVLFLRPTESPTIFIQQLGRGLRLHESKGVLTVLDFVGQAHKKYNFRAKFQSLLGRSHHSIKKEFELDFPSLPKSCSIKMEPVARKIVLDNISQIYNNLPRLRQMVESYPLVSTKPFTLANFLDHFGLVAQDLYKTSTLTQLRNNEMQTSQASHFSRISNNLKGAFMKVAKINDLNLLRLVKEYLKAPRKLQNEADNRRLLMFYYTLFNEAPRQDLFKVFSAMKKHNPDLYDELEQLVDYTIRQVDHLPRSLDIEDHIPLELHASYSTNQVLAALGVHDLYTRQQFREGVKYIEDLNLDIFFITLNKTSKSFSESTRYEDYAINDRLFHWQSQSRTTVTSPTGQRYINMKANGSRVLLFVREDKTDSYGATETFRCLGLADYVSHEGTAPISIIYRLREPMPLHVLRASNQVVNII